MRDSRPRTSRALPLPRRDGCTRARGAFHDKCGCRSHWADPQVLVDALTLTARSSPNLSMRGGERVDSGAPDVWISPARLRGSMTS